MKAQLPKINLVTLSGAVLLFLFPWIDVSCNGSDIATQTGLQLCHGGASPSKQLEALGNDSKKSEAEDDGAGASILACLALLAALAGAGAAAAVFRGKALPGKLEPGHLAAAALAALLLQWAIGFPIADALSERGKGGDAELAKTMEAAIRIETETTGWFLLELILLAIPTAVVVYQILDARQAKPPGGG